MTSQGGGEGLGRKKRGIPGGPRRLRLLCYYLQPHPGGAPRARTLVKYGVASGSAWIRRMHTGAGTPLALEP